MEGFRGTIRVGELLLAEPVPKTVSFPSLFLVSPYENTPFLSFLSQIVLVCCFFFLFSPQLKVLETMRKDPRQREAEAALLFLPDLAVN